MKKLLLILLAVAGMVGTASAEGITIYLDAQNGWKDNANLAVWANNQFVEFTNISGTYYKATLPEGEYENIVLVRYNPAKSSVTDNWDNKGVYNQSEDISTSQLTTFNYFRFNGTWDKNSSGKADFDWLKAHKIYVKNVQTSDVPKLHTYEGETATNGDWPGTAMDVDGDYYSYLNLTGNDNIYGIFTLTGDDDKSGDITFDLSSGDAYYYYYPTIKAAGPEATSLSTPAKILVRAKNTSAVSMYYWNLPTGSAWEGFASGGTLTTETVSGVDWYALDVPFASFTGIIYTYNNGDSDNDKTSDYNFSFSSGESQYFYANSSNAVTAPWKLESKYYLVYKKEDSWTDISTTGNAYEELTRDGESFSFTGTISNTDGKYIVYAIAPESALTISDGNASFSGWDNLFYFDGSSNYEVMWQNMTDNVVQAKTWKRWQIQPGNVKADYDITFNFATMKWSSSPSFERTISDDYATFSSDYDVAIPEGVTAYYATAAEAGTVTMTSISNGIPSDQGAFLKASDDTYKFTPATTTESSTTNLLVKGTSSGVAASGTDSKYNYVFASQGDELGFFNVATAIDNDMTGKAYLQTTSNIKPANGARVAIVFDEESTGIETVKGEGAALNGYYNLSGQRVAQPTRGLFIVNGKKVLVK